MTTYCRHCRGDLGEIVVDLGSHPISNAFLRSDEFADERQFPLVVRRCPACHLVQAVHDVPPHAMFTSDYAYFSSTSTSWVEHAERYADAMIRRLDLNERSLVLEVACNDGYLLRHFLRRGIPVLGVEPTDGTAAVAEAVGVPVVRDYFGCAVAESIVRNHAADLAIGNNVLAHVPDLADFIAGFNIILKPDGVATFEFPHLLSLLIHGQFDTIYHEHFSYLSLIAAVKIFERQGLRVFDVDRLPTHGGSLRVYACRTTSKRVVGVAVAAVLAEELAAGLNTSVGYASFSDRAASIISAFQTFIDEARREGKKVAAYGAAAKGNTFLNACRATATDIVMVADKSASKQGRYLPGSHIPIVTPATLLEARPDYVVILPWNIEEEIRRELEPLRKHGTRFVVAMPTMRIV